MENKKYKYINDLNVGEEVIDFFMVKSMSIKKGSNQKYYLNMILGDKTGEIGGKKWDLADEEIENMKQIPAGNIIKVKGTISEWNGIKQMTVTRIRQINSSDDFEIADFIKAAPEDPEDMYDFIYSVATNLLDEDLKKLCMEVLEEYKEKLMYYPAASKNHHAEYGGLLWHMKRMLMAGQRLCEVYGNVDVNLVLAGVILHDMEKINEINANEMGISDGYSFEGVLLGHLVLGVRELEKRMTRLNFPREKTAMVEHMILSHHYEPEFGSPKRPLFPEAELLHYLDIIDARMYDMEEVLDKTNPGEFSERTWVLDNRRLYKREEPICD